MVHRLNTADVDFEAAFAALIDAPRGGEADVAATVAAIIADIRENGLEAVRRYSRAFDGFEPTERDLIVSAADIDAAMRAAPPAAIEALRLAGSRIRAYHETQRPENHQWTDEAGVTLGWRWTPVASAGIYAPGGTAAYPSSVLMTAIPAKVAGVPRLCLASPARGGLIDPLTLAAAKIAGVDEVIRIGGAQAIAAMAFGAGPVRSVDLIAGPGNAYVAEAKRQVFGKVGMDAVAGPSEILVVADAANDPDWIAADLLSQLEHDADAQAILITDDAPFSERVIAALVAQLAVSPRREIAGKAWRVHSAIILVRSLDEAPALIDRLAPEHVELAVAEPQALLARISNAGAVFLGRHAPEAIGDYIAGPSHVLPTGGAARFSSGLSVATFMKRTSIVGAGAAALAAIGPAAATLADAEGLPGHAHSIRLRLK